MVSKNLSFVVSSLIIIGLTSFFVDQPVSLWFSLPEAEPYRKFAFSITDIGLSEHWFLLAILTFFISKLILLYHRHMNTFHARVINFKNWGAHFFFALSTSGFLLQITKHIVGRQRPHISEDRLPFVFHPLSNHWDWHSFPSGHTQTLFCVAVLFAIMWPKQRNYFWILAFALSFTRVMSVQHFLSDVVGGALIGILGAELSLYYFARWVPAPKKDSFT